MPGGANGAPTGPRPWWSSGSRSRCWPTVWSCPGAIASIESLTPDGPERLWEGRYEPVAACQRFELTLHPPRRVEALRLVVDPRRVDGPTALDAIGLEPAGGMGLEHARVEVVESPSPWPVETVWAARVEDVSHWKGLEAIEPPRGDFGALFARWSQERPPRSAWQALGAPDVYPAKGERAAWTVEGAGEQHIAVTFARSVTAQTIVVVDPNGPAALVRVEDLTGATPRVLWQGGIDATRGHQVRLQLPAPTRIERLRLVVDPRGATSTIDAIGLVPTAPGGEEGGAIKRPPDRRERARPARRSPASRGRP